MLSEEGTNASAAAAAVQGVCVWGKMIRLLGGSVIPGAGADVHFLAEGDYFDGVVTPVGSHFRRLVGQGVLAAQLFLDGGKRLGNIGHLIRKESAAAGGVGQLFQHPV